MTATTLAARRPSTTKKTTTTKAKGKACKPAAAKPVSAEEDKPVASVNWYKLMAQALAEPAELNEARKHFRQYSLCNRWMASMQLREAGLPLQPINTFKGWLAVNRAVVKGQKASISMNMPVPVRARKKDESGAPTDEFGKDIVFTKFMLRSYWFHLGQTEGEEYVPPALDGAEWHMPTAMKELEIVEQEFAFAHVSDARDGHSVGNTISVSPLAFDQVLARIHEMSRVMLGHTAEVLGRSVPPDLAIQQLEADAATYLCAASVGLGNLGHIAARLQESLKDTALTRIPERSLNRAFGIAHKLVDAGYC